MKIGRCLVSREKTSVVCTVSIQICLVFLCWDSRLIKKLWELTLEGPRHIGHNYLGHCKWIPSKVNNIGSHLGIAIRFFWVWLVGFSPWAHWSEGTCQHGNAGPAKLRTRPCPQGQPEAPTGGLLSSTDCLDGWPVSSLRAGSGLSYRAMYCTY